MTQAASNAGALLAELCVKDYWALNPGQQMPLRFANDWFLRHTKEFEDKSIAEIRLEFLEALLTADWLRDSPLSP